METPTIGKYRILAELGRGGMADVFLAMVAGPAGSGFSKLNVVKRLRENLAEDPEFVAMLMDEARISARLSHPNVVQTHEIGVEAGQYFLAMEYLDGQPLHRVQKRAAKTGRIPRDFELLVISDVLAGLHHAHELTDYDGTALGIVHRDVTPQNVFITYTGHVKVVDFGIAKAAGRACETRQGVVKGKVRYMAPEQAMGLALDRRADIFSVGLLMWEALTGERFWGQTDEISIARSLIASTFDPSPRTVAPDVPEELDAICKKAMAYRPEDRYATAEEFRNDLDRYLSTLDAVSMRRQLGSEIASLFTKERQLLREIIERAGRDAAPVSFDRLAFPKSSSTIQVGHIPSVRPLVLETASTPSAPPQTVSLAPPPAQAPKRGAAGLVAGVVAGGAMLALAAGLLLVRNTHASGVAAGAGVSGAAAPRAEVSQPVTVIRLSPERPAPEADAAGPRNPRTPAPVRFAPPPPKAAPQPPPAAGDPVSPGDHQWKKKVAIDMADPWKGTPAGSSSR